MSGRRIGDNADPRRLDDGDEDAKERLLKFVYDDLKRH